MKRTAAAHQIAITALALTLFGVPIHKSLGAPSHRAALRGHHNRDSVSLGLRTMERRETDRSEASTMTWSAARQKLSSPAEISRAVKSRVKYTPDMSKDDEWRSGAETWERKEGDCEDYAAAVKDLCESSGHKADIVVLQSRSARAAHAVATGTRNGQVWVSSNGSYQEFSSFEDARQSIARELGWSERDVEITELNDTDSHSRTNIQTATQTIR